MRKVALFLLFLVLTCFVFLSSFAALAQSPYYTFDFTIDDQGWDQLPDGGDRGLYVAGVGWHKHPDRPDRVVIWSNFTAVIVSKVDVYISDCTGIAFVAILADNVSCTSGLATFTYVTPTSKSYLDISIIKSSESDPFITRIEVFAESPTPTPSNTPTITLTPTITPTVGPSAWGRSCILLGQANANFTAGNAWSYTAPVTTPPGTSVGVLLPSSVAGALALRLSPTAQYRVEVKYRLTEIPDGLGLISLQLGVGADQDHYAPIAHITGVQSFEYGPVNAVPNSDGLYHLIFNWSSTPDPGLIIDWICVSQTSSGTRPQDNSSPETSGQCESCSREATGDLIADLFAVFGWLWCGFRQFFDCVLLPIIYGGWTTLRHLFGFAANVIEWLGRGIEAFNGWILSMFVSVIYWLGGSVANLINPLFSWLGNLVRSVGSIGDFLRALLGNSAATERIVEFFESSIRAVNDLIYVAQLLLTGYMSGVTSSTSIPTQYAPQCFTPGSILYYPCLGFYVAENTILEGPVWYLIPFVMGIIAWNVGFWALRQVTKTLSQN